MNYRLVSRFLGILSIFFGIFMLFSLPWAYESVGQHTDPKVLPRLSTANFTVQDPTLEKAGFNALVFSSITCLLVGALLMSLGRGSKVQLFRREAMAIVGLSWILATFLGALPFWLSGTIRGPSVRIFSGAELGQVGQKPVVMVVDTQVIHWQAWRPVDAEFTGEQIELLRLLIQNNATGMSRNRMNREMGNPNAPAVFDELRAVPELSPWLWAPGDGAPAPADRIGNYRLRWARMTWADCLFESQSGFSTTGATVLSDLEDPNLVPHCILFWRSSSHFLGGLGIIVLFVAVLGHGSAGKALMRAEMPGPSKEGSTERMQHTAWIFAMMYTGLNAVLTLLLKLMGMTWFDAICHAFGTMATGGFSTYNASLGHFTSPLIQYTVTLFMILAGTNFTLLYFLVILKPMALVKDVEWRTYIGIIAVTVLVIVIVGMAYGDPGFTNLPKAVQYALFQVVSIVTTTGYGTNDFDQWNQLSRLLLLLIMFVGGCAGSTGGGMKVIRHLLFAKILRLEVLKAYRPRLVKPLQLGEQIVDDPAMRRGIPVYFCFVFGIFAASWIAVVGLEPDTTWGVDPSNKLIDSASAIAATLHNIGPGLGTVGASTNYGHFTSTSKCIFTLLMMLGRLEIYPILVLAFPSFWRTR